MKDLNISELLEIYNGEKSYSNLEIRKSKELALDEINRRKIIYREKNNVSSLLNEINKITININNIDLNFFKLAIIDSGYFANDLYICDDILYELSDFSKNVYQKELKDKLIYLNDNYSILKEIWLNDPEYLRYTSKFRGEYNFANIGQMI